MIGGKAKSAARLGHSLLSYVVSDGWWVTNDGGWMVGNGWLVTFIEWWEGEISGKIGAFPAVLFSYSVMDGW